MVESFEKNDYDGLTSGTDTMDALGAARLALAMEISKGVSNALYDENDGIGQENVFRVAQFKENDQSCVSDNNSGLAKFTNPSLNDILNTMNSPAAPRKDGNDDEIKKYPLNNLSVEKDVIEKSYSYNKYDFVTTDNCPSPPSTKYDFQPCNGTINRSTTSHVQEEVKDSDICQELLHSNYQSTDRETSQIENQNHEQTNKHPTEKSSKKYLWEKYKASSRNNMNRDPDYALENTETNDKQKLKPDENFVISEKSRCYEVIKQKCRNSLASVCSMDSDSASDAEIPHPRLSPSTEVFLAKNEDLEFTADFKQIDQEKKKFLKKGSRKEPSALHSLTPKEKQHVRPVTHEFNKNVSDKSNMEKLEKMQLEHATQLEKRLQRREKAREEINRRNKQKAEEAKCSQIRSANGGRVDLSHSQKNKVDCEKVDIYINSNDDEDESSEDGSSEDGSSEDESSVSTVMEIDNEDKNKNVNNTKNTNNSSMNRNLKQRKFSIEKDPIKSPLPGLRRKDKTKLLSRKPLCHVNARLEKGAYHSRNTNRPQEHEEQWQILKSMRKRQEAALTAAEKERDEVRSWAVAERESVEKWAENQRTLIKREKQRASNLAMSYQRRIKQERLIEEHAEKTVFNQKQARAEINDLKENIHKLKIDLDATKSRNRLNEKKLKDCISSKEEELHFLHKEIEILKCRNSDLSLRVEELSKKQKRVSKKKQTNVKQIELVSQENFQHKRDESIIIPDQKKDPTSEKDSLVEVEQNIGEDMKVTEGCDNLPIQKDIIQCNISQLQPVSTKDSANEQNFERKVDEVDGSIKHTVPLKLFNEDITEKQKEDWLQSFIHGLQNASKVNEQSIHGSCQNNFINNNGLALFTPFKGKKEYNPNDYVVDHHDGENQTQYQPSFNQQSSSEMVQAHSSLPSHSIDSTTDERLNDGNSTSQFHTPAKTINNKGKTRTERIYPDGHKTVFYPNGTEKEVLLDGTTIVRFKNGDIKTTYVKVGIIVYYYATAKTSHTSHPDGLELFEFANGQTERHYPDGKKELHFPDGTRKFIAADGTNETEFPKERIKVIETLNGSKEIIQL